MNLVKYYRRKRDGRVEVRAVRVTQKVGFKHFYHGAGRKEMRVMPIQQHRPTVEQADRVWTRAGWTRKRLWTVMPLP